MPTTVPLIEEASSVDYGFYLSIDIMDEEIRIVGK